MQRFRTRTMEEAAAMLNPTKVAGKWKSAVISKRRAAVLRKEAVSNHTFGQWTPGVGGWCAAWDEVKLQVTMRPPKLHKHERREEAR